MQHSIEQIKTRTEICRLAFSESLKGLEIQDATLMTVRQSAGVLGTFSGLVATLLGSEVIPSLPTAQGMKFMDWIWPILAITSLVASLIIVFLIIKPRDGWIFHMNGNSIISQFAEHEGGPVDLDVMYGVLTGFSEENYEGNVKILNKLYLLLSILLFLLLIQIFSWLMALF